VFAHAGARVILCSRSVAAGEKAIQEEFLQLGHGNYTAPTNNVVVKELDLNSLKSVKNFAMDILATESRIDYLICNAGIMALPKFEHTQDGFEKQIGVNAFGHFYLIQLLLPKMKSQGTEGRVVVLSSSAHNMGAIDLQNLHFKTTGTSTPRSYNNWVAYGQSKLADMLIAKELADRTAGTPITACSLHPGIIQTALWRSSFFASGIGASILGSLMSNKTIPQGAATTMFACLSPTIMNEDRGAYLVDCQASPPACEQGKDVKGTLRKELWNTIEKEINEVTKSF
jgi:NAD(P)-dependent dehydrogenase (short-subunit alcohol dehydrogenase family)